MADKKPRRIAFAERLSVALDEIGMPPMNHGRQTEVSKLFNVSQGAARKWLFGESYPEIDKLPDICRKLNVTMKWLVSGSGDMHDENSDNGEAQIDESLLAEVIDTIEAVVRKTGTHHLSPSQKAVMIRKMYQYALEHGKVEESMVIFAIEMAS